MGFWGFGGLGSLNWTRADERTTGWIKTRSPVAGNEHHNYCLTLQPQYVSY